MSKIEWTGETWNCVVGCSIVSPGCTNCYAMRTAARIARMSPTLEHYKGLTQPSKAGPVWTGKVALSEDALLKPLKRRKPTTYFVNSMSDLFHEDVPDGWIDRVFAVMALTPQHTYQVLTKRSDRMLAYLSKDRNALLDAWSETEEFRKANERIDGDDNPNDSAAYTAETKRLEDARARLYDFDIVGQLTNVWLGVSAEDQRRADERIPDLLATPAAVRFVSAEPLLGPINFNRDGIMYCFHRYAWGDTVSKINWIIVGGESGPGAREFKLGWARDIVRQCQEAGVAVFVKQIGARPTDAHDGVELPVTIRDRKGGDMAEWPPELCVRQMPSRADNYVGDLVL